MKLLNANAISKALQDKIKNIVNAKVISYQNKLQIIAKQSIEDLEAIDTGLLQSRTNVKIISTSKSVKIIYNTNNVEYARYVYFGLGTNVKYGARKFNLISVKKTKQLFETGSYDRIFGKGGDNNTGDLAKGKKANLNQRRGRIFKSKFKITRQKAKKLGIYKQLVKYQKSQNKRK